MKVLPLFWVQTITELEFCQPQWQFCQVLGAVVLVIVNRLVCLKKKI